VKLDIVTLQFTPFSNPGIMQRKRFIWSVS